MTEHEKARRWLESAIRLAEEDCNGGKVLLHINQARDIARLLGEQDPGKEEEGHV